MYGLIVIGDDLSSHVAAAVACNNGIKTALIAEHGMGDHCFIGDLAFNIDCTPLSGFGEIRFVLLFWQIWAFPWKAVY